MGARTASHRYQPATTGFVVADLVTLRSAEVCTVAVAVDVLLLKFGSLLVVVTVAVLEMLEPFGALGLT